MDKQADSPPKSGKDDSYTSESSEDNRFMDINDLKKQQSKSDKKKKKKAQKIGREGDNYSGDEFI